jgi:hypothetical protein
MPVVRESSPAPDRFATASSLTLSIVAIVAALALFL